MQLLSDHIFGPSCRSIDPLYKWMASDWNPSPTYWHQFDSHYGQEYRSGYLSLQAKSQAPQKHKNHAPASER